MTTNREKLKLIPLVPFALALILGLFSGYFLSLPLWLWLLLMCLSLIIGLLLGNSTNWRFVPLLFCTFFLGIFLMGREDEKLTPLLPTENTTITIVVDDSPKMSEWGCYFSGIVVEGNTSVIKAKKIRCSWTDPVFEPHVGQTLIINGKLRTTENIQQSLNAKNSNFNYERWLKSHSIVAQMKVYGERISLCEKSRLEELGFLKRVGIKAKILRARVLHALEKEGLSGEDFAIVAAMGFGDKSSLSESTREVFSQTGASHLLALSGMHLGILFVLLTMVMSNVTSLFMNRIDGGFLSQIIVIATIWCYVVLVGMSQSVVRSAVMLTIYSAISSSSRQKMSVNTLAATAIIMLFANPMSIWDVGFQMSFMAMVGIFVYYNPLYNIIGIEWLFEHSIIRKVWALICVSISAQVGTMPLAVFYFGRIPSLFLLTNLIAIPIVTLLLYCVFICMAFWFVPFIRALSILLIQGLTWCLAFSLRKISAWDIASINNISINWIQMMLIYAMIIVVTIMISRIIRIYKRQRAYSILK